MDFQINIHDRVAELRSNDGRMPVLVCDNTDHRILFSFDAEWGVYPEKTARFVFRESFGQGSLVYVDVPFVGTSVNVPSLHNVREVWVGVIAGGLITTSAARISCLSSIYGFPAIEEGSENTEAKEVSLCFAEGDVMLDVQTVTPSLGKTMASVGIKRPAMLIPENIRAGITIAGITGTYSAENVQGSVLVPPTISLSGDILTIVPGEGELSESFEILVGGETAYHTTETTVDLKTALVGLPMGTRLITVIAWNDTLGLNSPSSNSVSYTVGALTAPTISLSGDILKISPGSGEVQIYRLYAGSSEIYSFAADTSINVKSILQSTYTEGTFTLRVRAANLDAQMESPFSNSVTFVLYDESKVQAPRITLDGNLLHIVPQDDNSASYEVYAGGETAYVDTVTTIDLSSVLSYLNAGDYDIHVVAWNADGTICSEASNLVTYSYGGTPQSYSLTMTIEGDDKLYYVVNGSVSDIVNGDYDGYWSASEFTLSDVTFSDTVLVMLYDTSRTLVQGGAYGCTVTPVAPAGNYGTYVKISRLTGDAWLALSTY